MGNEEEERRPITGSITMDKNHNPIKPAVILEYVPNGYKFITSISPDAK